MEVLQVPAELERMVDLYRDSDPRRVLEIGCWDGGTLRVWLKTGPELVVAVDLEHRNPDAYEGWRKPETELVVVTGDSQSEETQEIIREHAPYDWVFIDGDHEPSPVRADVGLTLPLVREGGIMALHDIVMGRGNNPNGPGYIFHDLAPNYRTDSFVEETGGEWGHGIGIVYL